MYGYTSNIKKKTFYSSIVREKKGRRFSFPYKTMKPRSCKNIDPLCRQLDTHSM